MAIRSKAPNSSFCGAQAAIAGAVVRNYSCGLRYQGIFVMKPTQDRGFHHLIVRWNVVTMMLGLNGEIDRWIRDCWSNTGVRPAFYYFDETHDGSNDAMGRE